MTHNTKDGIAAQLESYATFYNIMRLRNELGHYKPDGTKGDEYSLLTPFTVLGRYHSDQFGQCRRLNRQLFTDSDRIAMLPVMTDEEFRTFFNMQVKPRIGESFFSTYEGTTGSAPSFPLPPPHIVCARCNGTWELNQCHDIDAEGDFEHINLSSFIGKTLREVETELSTKTDALRHFGSSIHIKNDKHTSPNYDKVWATPEEQGWRDLSWDYVVQDGDFTTLFRTRFYHGQCFRHLSSERAIAKELENIATMRQMFEEAGFEDVSLTRVSIPEHINKWLTIDLGRGEDVSDFLKACIYYKVETRQGSLGILFIEYAILDLEGSGVTIAEFESKSQVNVLAGFPQITELTGEPEQLLRLWQLMVKHQLKR